MLQEMKGGLNTKQCSKFNRKLMLQPKKVKYNFTCMRKISLLNMKAQEAHLTAVIVVRLYLLSLLN